MASEILFPDIKPSSRSYTPGSYPQTEFVAQNGAKTVLRYGDKKVDAKLTLGFTNITDSQANQILNVYETVNSVYDYILFKKENGLTGIDNDDLSLKIKERSLITDEEGKSSEIVELRYRFDSPPTVTSVNPGRSNVQCKFVGCLDGD